MTVCAVPTVVGTTYSIGSWSAADALPGVTDAAGNVWSIQDEKGLMHTPAFRTNVVDREQSDGVFDGPAWLPGRTIVLDGVIRSPDFPTLYAAMRTVRGLLAGLTRTAPLVAAYPDITIQTVVRKDGECLVDKIQSAHPIATFSMLLYAPDPTLYGATLQSASTGVFAASGGRAYAKAYPVAYGPGSSTGLIAVTNNGDTTTYPIITITAGSGPLVNPTITELGGNALMFPFTMNAGDVLVVDTGARTVLLNGGARAFPLANATLGCGPGATQLLFSAVSSAVGASMSVAWRDAYE